MRGVVREPIVTAFALVSLALGIAANTTVFSLVQAVEFPPLPYPEASRIVFVESRNVAQGLARLPVSVPDALDLASATRTLEQTALMSDYSAAIREARTPTRFAGRMVPTAFFRVMRVQPVQGRVLDGADAEETVVISARLWREQLGGGPTVLGRALHLDARTRVVVGVMPEGFDPDADFWLPLSPSVPNVSNRGDRAFTFRKSRLTLFAEVVNLLNQNNYRSQSARLDLRTGEVFGLLETLFPLLPSIGVLVEF